MPEAGPIRAFLALDPPQQVLQRIAELQATMRREIRGALSWVRPEGIHLTLKFFGNIAAADVETIAQAVAGPAAGIGPLNLEARGLGVFPGIRRPRVLWLGIAGDVGRLTVLQKTVEQGLEACGFPREERPFRAHLTLARVKAPQELKGLDAVLRERASESAGAFTATALTLFRSELTPKGALYTALAHFPLQG